MNKLSDVKLMNDKENQIDDNGIAEVFIKKIFVHPDYVCGKKTENDIGKRSTSNPKCNVLRILILPALLYLESPIKFNENIQPLCLSTDNQSSSDLGRVTGWGWTNENFSVGEKPNVKQSADVPIWDNDDCQSSYTSLLAGNKISDNQMCAGGRNGGLDSCWADSGSPLISKTTGHLIGIVSTGVGCARKGLPGIYTRVSRYTKWIENNI